MLKLGESNLYPPNAKIDSLERLLAPDSCFSAKLILLSLAQGYSQVEAIRVSDVVTNEFTDIRDLPDIVAVG